MDRINPPFHHRDTEDAESDKRQDMAVLCALRISFVSFVCFVVRDKNMISSRYLRRGIGVLVPMRSVLYLGRWECPDGFGRPERIGFVFW